MTRATFTDIEAAAHAGAFGNNAQPLPTEAQRKSGDYRKGRLTLHGLRIAIEQPRGSVRTGTDPDGTAWSSRLAAHYGYFPGHAGADGDDVDVFIGPSPDAATAFIINQSIAGRFDEHKVVLGAVDEDHARRLYAASYAPGWRGLRSIVAATIPQLKHWLRHGDKRRAVTAAHLNPQGTPPMNRVFWNSDAQPEGVSLDQVLYQLRVADGGDNLLLDAATLNEVVADSDGVLALDALVVPVNLLTRKMEVLKTVMERASGDVKPLNVQISEPFKQRGVTQVAALFELSDGQTVTIYFHNPDTTPNRLAPTDDLVSWKWLLNKKDITIVVAPERGADLNPREVARRIMRLAEKNSPAFQRANAKRAERMTAIQSLKTEIAGLEAELTKAQRELEAEQILAEERLANPKPAPAGDSDDPATDRYGQNIAELNRRGGEWERRIAGMSDADALKLAFAAGLTKAKSHNARELLAQEHPDDLDAAMAKLGASESNSAEAPAQIDWMGFDKATLPNGTIQLEYKHAKVGMLTFAIRPRNDDTYQVQYGTTSMTSGMLKDVQTAVEWAAGVRADVLKSKGVEDVGPVAQPEAEPFEHAGITIYPINVKDAGLRWAVQLREKPGVGDTLWKTRDEAMKEAGRQALRRDEAARRAADEQAAAEAAAAAAAAFAETLLGKYLATLSPMSAGAARKALEKRVRLNGVETTVAGIVEAKHAAGELDIETAEVDKIQPMSRRAYNRATNAEQAAHERRVAAAGTKTVYYVNDLNLGASAYRYAAFLLGSATATAGESEEGGDAETAAVLPKLASATPEFTDWLAANSDAIAAVEAIEAAATAAGGSVSWGADAAAAMDSVAAAAQEAFKAARPHIASAARGVGKAAATAAAAKLLTYFRDFIRSDAALAKIPSQVRGLAELLNTGHGDAMTKEQAAAALDKLVNVAVNRRGGAELTAKQQQRFEDFQHDARVIDEALNKRIRRSGRNILRTPEMKARFPEIDNPAAFDAAAMIEGMAVAKGVMGGTALDDASHAIATLQNALDVAESNEPISRAEGNAAQADLERDAAASFREALDKLGAEPAMDSDDEDDFDEDAEWEATPDEEGDVAAALDGDFAGHPFRGNQYRKGSRTSGTAVAASIHAKKAERGGNARAVRNAHRIAHYSHKAAALAVTTRAATRYHRKMAKLHAKHGGVEFVMDDASPRGLEKSVSPSEAKAIIRAWEKATGDDWGSQNFYALSAKELRAVFVDIEMGGKSGRAEAVRAEAAAAKRMAKLGILDSVVLLDAVQEDYAGAALRNAAGEEAGSLLIYSDGSVSVRASNGSRVAGADDGLTAATEGVRRLLAGEGANGRKEFVDAMNFLTPFLSRQQFAAIKSGGAGEERQFFYDKAAQLAKLIRDMPKTYEQDGKGDKAVAYLHYFKGGGDWYITEKDMDGGVEQAFGLANPFGDDGELGYISIAELVANGVELDLHWSPKTLSAIRGKDAEPNPDPEVGPSGAGVVVPVGDTAMRELLAKEVAEILADADWDDTTIKEVREALQHHMRNGVAYQVEDLGSFTALVRTMKELARKNAGEEVGADGDDALVEAGVAAAKSNGIAKILTSDYFTMNFEGDDVVVDGELRARIEGKLGEKLVESVVPGLEGQVTLIPESQAPADAGIGRVKDMALFQSVIDGTAANILAPELADELEAAYLRHEADPVMAGLFEQAVNAYTAAMMSATANL